MNPENSNNEITEPADSGLEFDEYEEVTHVRKRIRKIDSYPPRPERTFQVDHYPVRRLGDIVETQIDEWGQRRMLKTAVALGNDETKVNVVESTLNQCMNAGKIHKFESNMEGGITTFTIYYRYQRS